MKVLETSPGRFELACEISGRPHSRTNKFGMFCDDPNCECERKSMSSDLGSFINIAADMFKQEGMDLDVDVLRKEFKKLQK